MPEYGVAREPFQPQGNASIMQRALYGILNLLYGSDAIQDAPLDMMIPLGGMARQVGRIPAISKTAVHPFEIQQLTGGVFSKKRPFTGKSTVPPKKRAVPTREEVEMLTKNRGYYGY